MTLAFGPNRRLRAHREFVRAQRLGRRVATAHFVLLVSAQPGSTRAPQKPRLGLVVSRKVGVAVARNRIKRVCRECFRTWPELLPHGTDLVAIAKQGAERLTLSQIRREWLSVHGQLLQRATEALALARSSEHVPGSPQPLGVKKGEETPQWSKHRKRHGSPVR
jgi:ribonuclease P protein component